VSGVTRTTFDAHEQRYAARMASVRSSAMRDLMAVTERPGMISLAGGLPYTKAFPPELLVDLTARVAREGCADALQYGPTEGLAALRELLAARMRADGSPVEASNVLVTTGGQQALDLLARVFLDPGDTVVCEGPTYPGMVPVLMAAQASVVQVPVDGQGIVVEALDEALTRARAAGRPAKLVYVIPTFQNPSGETLAVDRRLRLLQVCARHDVLVVEDDPYSALRFEGEPLPTLRSLDPDGRVIYVGTLSKIFSPGLRIGWIAADHAILAKLNLCKQAADLCSSTLSQRLALAFLEDERSDGLLERLRALYAERRDAMCEALDELLPDGSSASRPEGGLFVWATLPAPLDTSDLLARCLARNVAFVPGRAAFLADEGARSLRLNFSAVDADAIVEGVRRIGAACAESLALADALDSRRRRAPERSDER
jgi:2-aminoadipate transaminase